MLNKKYFLALLFSFSLHFGFSQSELNSLLKKINEGLSVEAKRTFEYYFYQGLEQKNRGELQNALNSFLKCADIDPGSSVVLFEAGKILLYGGQLEKGIELLTKAVSLDKSNYWYALTLANAYVNVEQISKAITILEDLHSLRPNDLEITLNLVAFYEQNKEFKKAIGLLSSLKGLNEYLDDINLELYRLYLSDDNIDGAISFMERNYKKMSSAKYAVLIGDGYARLKQFEKAKKWYSKSFGHIGDYGPAWISMLNLAVINRDQTAFIEAFNKIKVNSSIESDFKIGLTINILTNESHNFIAPDLADSMVVALYRSNSTEKNFNSFFANYTVSKGDTAGSVMLLQREIELYPDNTSAWLQLLSTYLQTESLTAANNLFQSGKDLNRNSDWFMMGSFVNFRLKDYEGTIESCLTGIQLSNNDKSTAQFYAQIGDAYFALNKEDSVVKYYSLALTLNNEDKLLLNNYAYYLSVYDRDLSLAESLASKCVSIDPGNYTFLDTYAWVLFRKGEYMLAKFYIEKAIDLLTTKEGIIYEHYGDILYFTGDMEKALINWIKAKEYGVESKYILKKIEEKKYFED